MLPFGALVHGPKLSRTSSEERDQVAGPATSVVRTSWRPGKSSINKLVTGRERAKSDWKSEVRSGARIHKRDVTFCISPHRSLSRYALISAIPEPRLSALWSRSRCSVGIR
ncbi:hypothetical protein BaRGS_00013568 [Batillaria attramentaria]|uniref:Uncharacterized protein n=1 Tax=Batillaria attramentaria TaxID=370345 RepID=A0ABD0L6Q8_9CAEN